MTVYQDKFITFILPMNLANKRVKREGCVWYASSKRLSIHIIIVYKDTGYYQNKVKEHYENVGQGGGLRRVDGPHKMVINGYETNYRFLINEVVIQPGRFSLSCELAITIENYVIYVDIFLTEAFDTNLFPLDEYMPFISSIKIHDFEGLKQECEEIERKNREKYSKPPKILPVDIPPNFTEISPLGPSDKSMGRSMKKDDFEIHIVDVTILGQEADIDMFKEYQKDDIVDESRKLFELKGKKCLVENMEDSKLDISRCQNISILLAFRGKCYSVSMKSDTPFDLNEYKIFLDSIGTKTKKSVKK
jgi:hypothetical protein